MARRQGGDVDKKKAGMPIAEYATANKQTLTGYGKADKSRFKNGATDLGSKDVPEADDCAMLAAAITHAAIEEAHEKRTKTRCGFSCHGRRFR